MTNEIYFKKMDGLVPVIVQDYKTNDVIMLGFMNEESWKITLKTGKVTFWSRTRNKIWTKGESSGNYLVVRERFIDCDNDSILIKAEALGPTCHTGAISCFFNKI